MAVIAGIKDYLEEQNAAIDRQCEKLNLYENQEADLNKKLADARKDAKKAWDTCIGKQVAIDMHQGPIPDLEEQLHFDKPIVFFDLETTGPDTLTARIVEFAAVRLDGMLRKELHFKVNPGIPIPADASAIHGIHDDDVVTCSSIEPYLIEIRSFFAGAVVGGFNITGYDLKVLENECVRWNKPVITVDESDVVDAFRIFKYMVGHKLDDAVWYYCRRFHEDAHEAMGDVNATINVFSRMLQKYADAVGKGFKTSELVEKVKCISFDPNAYDKEGKLVKTDNGLAITFGKHAGKTLMQIAKTDPGCLSYMAPKMDDPMVKQAMLDAYRGNRI